MRFFLTLKLFSDLITMCSTLGNFYGKNIWLKLRYGAYNFFNFTWKFPSIILCYWKWRVAVNIQCTNCGFLCFDMLNMLLVNPPTRLWLGCNNHVTSLSIPCDNLVGRLAGSVLGEITCSSELTLTMILKYFNCILSVGCDHVSFDC